MIISQVSYRTNGPLVSLKAWHPNFGCCTLHGLGMWSVAMEGLLKYTNCTEEIMHPKESLG